MAILRENSLKLIEEIPKQFHKLSLGQFLDKIMIDLWRIFAKNSWNTYGGIILWGISKGSIQNMSAEIAVKGIGWSFDEIYQKNS